jgi:hypothetical protein
LFANISIVSEAYGKIPQICMPHGLFKQRYQFLPTLQITLGIEALFKKIYGREPIFTIFSNIGEGLQNPCFNNARSVSQPDINAALGNNYCLEIIKTWFAEQF